MRRVLATLVLAAATALPAHAAGWTITSFSSDITITNEAAIDVRETIIARFDEPRHGIVRTIPYRYATDSGAPIAVPIELQGVTDASGQAVRYETKDDGTNVIVKIGDPKRTVTGEQTYVLSYTARAALNFLADHDELYWNVTGEAETTIESSSAVVHFPSAVAVEGVQFTCYTGPSGSRAQQCDRTLNPTDVTFSAHDALTVVVGMPSGIVTKPADYDALRNDPGGSSTKTGTYNAGPILTRLGLGVNLAAIVLGIIAAFAYWRRFGRDPAGAATEMVQYDPPADMRPAEVGVLIDERVSKPDVTATIVDLAVRGYLKIREVESEKLLGLMHGKDYELDRLRTPGPELKEYERRVLEALFPDGTTTMLSALRSSFPQALRGISSSLYDDVTAGRYFVRNPQTVRLAGAIAGAAVVGLTFWLGLRFFAVGVFGAIIMLLAVTLPKRTKRGVDANWHARGFKEYLAKAERYRLQWQEREGIFETFLPYAMVFGVAEHWSKVFAGLQRPSPTWYEGRPGSTFNTLVLWSALNSFASTAQRTLTTPPAASGGSGFGGGGFSGGGFGGGGTGSW